MTRTNWTARLAWALLLLLAGAALATWGLARWDGGARFFGVAEPAPRPVNAIARPVATPSGTSAADARRIEALERRLGQVESATREAVGSYGRADALLITFAARRAIDRGVPLGYLEGLLVERFGGQHQFAVARIITAGRTPETLDQLTADFIKLEPVLRGGAPEESWWQSVRRELGTIVNVRRSDRPSQRPRARYDRALASLEAGEVAAALAETQRLPSAPSAEVQAWTERARRYVGTQRALDELESAALVGDERAEPSAPRS